MRKVILFMLPEDLDYHTDDNGNILCFDSFDELSSYLRDNNINEQDVSCFDAEALDD